MNTEIIEFHQSKLLINKDNGHKYIAVKPICEAIGVGFSGQRKVINNDPILGSVVELKSTTGADNKQYEMFCIPARYVFGWLFMIHPGNVKEEARDKIIRYKKECYDVLYEYYTEGRQAAEKKERYLSSIQSEIDSLKEEKKQIGKTIKDKQAEFKKVAVTPATQLDMFLEEPTI